MKRILSILSFIFLITFFDVKNNLYGQTTIDGRKTNNISSAVPFLLISPDAKAGAMGDVGAATAADAYSIHWNPAKMAYIKQNSGLSLSYSPWLKNLAPDISFAYLTAYNRLDERNVISGSLRYFSLGNIDFVALDQTPLGSYVPSEFALDIAFSRQFGESFSLGTAVRYIRSNLSYGLADGNESLRPATGFATDVSAYFNRESNLFGTSTNLSFGLNISNIGTKIGYARGGAQYFLPANLKLGGAAAFNVAANDKFTFALDLNKLLVPTSPVLDANGEIISGRDPDRSVVSGIFGSFSDAPGGFAEEMREISYSLGTEYLYNDQFALRAGYFYENPTKGNRQFFTLGAGFLSNKFGLDFAYILANQTNSPLAQTLRFSLVYNFEKRNKIRS